MLFEKYSVIVKNFIYLFLIRGTDLFIPILLTPYLIHTLDLEGFGKLAFAMSFASYFGILIKYGFSITAVRELSRCTSVEEDTELFNNFFNVTLFLAIISIMISIIIIGFVPYFGNESILYLSYITLIIVQSIFPIWFFQAKNDLKNIFLFVSFGKFLYIILVFLLVNRKEDYYFVPIIFSLCSTIPLIASIYFILIKYEIKLKYIGILRSKNTLLSSKDVFITQLAPSLYNNTSVFILGLVQADKVVGLYSAIMNLMELIISIGRLILTSFISSLSLSKSFHFLFTKIMLFCCLLSIAFFVFFNDLILKFYINQYDDLSKLIYLSALFSTVFAYVNLIYNQGYLMLYGFESIARNISVYSSIMSLFFSVILTFYYGALGAVFSVCIARVIMSISSFYYVKWKVQ